MKTKFTPKFIKENKGCYSLKQVNSLSFIKQKSITLEDVFKSKIPFKDKIWFLISNCDFDYENRRKCFYGSKKLQELYTKKYSSLGVDFSSWCSSLICSAGLYFKSEENTILSEILEYLDKN